ncbi:MAG: fused MFS/spermidine synthase [Rhodocyclaceae bacterium]|nr:fused MFS/spermidine synthase [Rhodocyclaceae bacterium]
MTDPARAHPPIQPIPRGLLYLTAGLTGGLVMVIEILGARVIGPFFGVSLFVWTALISVTLLSLAGGYATGGWLADRHPRADWLFGLIAAAGGYVLLVPVLKLGVMEFGLAFGLRGGTFVAALILFGPSLFLLGCVSPYLLRLAAADLARLGRTAGVLYAVSTAGSFAGSALTGFYLLGYVGVSNGLRLAGAILVALAVAHFLLARRGAPAAVAAALLLPALAPHGDLPSVRLEDGTEASVVAARDGFYGAVKVIEYRGSRLTTREMIIDGLVQGGMDAADGRPIYEYAYLLSRLPLAVRPEGRSALVVGLGMGAAPRWLARAGIDTEVVEIDPLVLDMARRHFDFPREIPVHIEDARTYLARAGRPFDFILLDVFNGDTTPGYLLSLEALHAVKARLAPGGVLALNLIGGVQGEEAMVPAIVRTLQAVFAGVSLHPAFAPAADAPLAGNFVLLASDGPLAPAARVALDDVHPLAASVRQLAQQPPVAVDTAGALILTDEFNPLDLLDTRYKESVRRHIIETTPHEILLAG